MAGIIEPRVLKGFRDYLPEAEIERKALLETLERAFRSFGFVPIDTPCLEYAEILLGKGGGETDKQVYRFQDNGGRDVALRFDLTVPFARFMAEHVDELYLPFRRYHMAKVWRGENTQRGRYREFMQCDFDIVGTDAAQADADIVLLIHAALSALGFGGFTIRMSHRGIFNRFLDVSGVRDKSAAVLHAVDKIEKIGAEETRRILAEEIGDATAARVLDFIEKEEDFESTLAKLEVLAGGPGPDSARLRAIWAAAREAGAEGCLILDPSITRGLDYYTGVVFETFLDEMPQLGSVCGGGRYDELASLYTTRRIPGVGAAIGLDRLLAGLETLGRARRRPGYADVLIVDVEESLEPRYQGIARAFRDAGIACEVFPEKKKLGQQFAYAEKKGIHFAIVVGGDEAATGTVLVKDITSRQSEEAASLESAIALVRGRLST
jgi:histidyl-tRNA synthetase